MLDQSIGGESSASFPLAPPAMARIDNEWCSLHAISDLFTDTTPFQGEGYTCGHLLYGKPKDVEDIGSTVDLLKMAGQTDLGGSI